MREYAVESSLRMTLDLNEKVRVLHVDDDTCFLKITKQCLEMEGPLQVDTAVSVEEALKRLDKEDYDIIVSDYQMPEKDGLEFLKTLREKGNNIPFIIFTGKGREEVAIRALNLGANQYLNKMGETETVYTELTHSITELVKTRKAEESLKESEAKYRTLVEQSLQGIVIAQRSPTRLVFANLAMARLLGYSADELTSLPPKEIESLIHPGDRALFFGRFGDRLRGKPVPSRYEFRAIRKDGSKILLEISSSRIEYKGEPAVQALFTDASERKNVEQVSVESQQRFAGLFNGNPEATVHTDPNMLILEINPRFTDLFGYSADEVKGRNLNEVIVPRDMMEEGRMLDQKAVDGYVYHNTLRMRKDGSLIPVSVSAAPIHIQGELEGYIGVYKDISMQEKERAQFEGLFFGNPEAASYLGPDYHILDINPRFQGLFGYSLEEIKGKYINDVVVPKDKSEEAEALDERAANGFVYCDTVRKRKDNTPIPVSVSAAPIVVKGKLVGYIAMYKDISELKSAEIATKEMMQKLAIMNEKLRVVGGLTRHDVQNKLSVVMGNLYLIRKKQADHPEITERLEDIESACSQIGQIFSFARDYERLGAEELDYINVEDAIQVAVSLFSGLREIKILNECHGLAVLADSLLRQLFYNLIDNSLKHGEHVTLIKIGIQKSCSSLKILYEDNGVGIPLQMRPKLFNEGFSTRKGSGYGLYLIRKMMEVYGWTIQETGEVGKGAIFTITIPKTNQNGKENYLIT